MGPIYGQKARNGGFSETIHVGPMMSSIWITTLKSHQTTAMSHWYPWDLDAAAHSHACFESAELIDGNPMMVYASHDWQGLLGQNKCDLDETPHVCPVLRCAPNWRPSTYSKDPRDQKKFSLRSLLAEVVQKHDDDQTK